MSNLLENEKSLHLARHSKDPVVWHPYGPVAVQKAKDANKPILLSIGYSSCHWCHVMADESFKDPKIADIINSQYIAVKVDKEEYPDIDAYYQLACQVMNGKGGWPLTAFLTPQMKPYFIGSYFPKNATEGIPSFEEILVNMAKAFKDENETVENNANQIVTAMTQTPKVQHKVEFEGHYPTAASILNAIKEYQDAEAGGYGSEPKFPHYAFMEWAVEHILEGMVPKEFADHIVFSIEKMIFSGLYDHGRGGVHRYCVDNQWQIPHFEKMLYDQAALIRMLSKLSLVYPAPAVFDALIQTLDFLKMEMLSEQGYFFSSQDSDSEGVEGLYFGFSKDEFLDALTDFEESLSDDQEKMLKWFDIDETGDFQGMNVIRINPKYKEEIYSPEGWTLVRKVRQALHEARKMRIPPASDTKGVAAWNFQLGSALIDAIQYTKIEAIQNAANDLLSHCIKGIHETFLYHDEQRKTRIKTTTTQGEHVPLFEDYAFFADFSLRLYELTGQDNFYENGIMTLKFIYKDFYQNDCLFTRACSHSDTEEYENIHTPLFDQAHKSALATYIGLLRKWSVVEADLKEALNTMTSTTEVLTHLSLQNPLAFGETLRALVYPQEAYRAIEIPLEWLKNKSLHPFLINFSSRFALKYHTEENWQIKTTNEVELKGTTLDEFRQVFTAPEPSQEGTENKNE